MTVRWYRVKKSYEKRHGGFIAIGPRYPGVLSEDSVVVLFTREELPPSVPVRRDDVEGQHSRRNPHAEFDSETLSVATLTKEVHERVVVVGPAFIRH